jgi:hypothetical protein
MRLKSINNISMTKKEHIFYKGNWYCIYDSNKQRKLFGIGQKIDGDVITFKMQNGDYEKYEAKYCTKIYEKELLASLTK